MRFRPRREDPLDINLTPLIDVVFLLLIFFMVSTTFERASELAIELPKASVEKKPPTERQIEVSIDAQGRHYVNGKQLVNTQVATVREALRKVAVAGRNLPVLVNADSKAPHQSVITVMDAAQQLGFVKLTFAAQRSEPGG